MISHDQHISVFLWTVLHELSNREALDATALIHRDDFGGCWQGRTVYGAIESVARDAVDAGHPAQALDIAAVQTVLMSAGHLTNDAFQMWWSELVAPTVPQAPGKWRLKELAGRVAEGHFRARHAEIYGREDSHLRPLEEITTEMNTYREELLKIYTRIPQAAKAAPTLQAVRDEVTA